MRVWRTAGALRSSGKRRDPHMMRDIWDTLIFCFRAEEESVMRKLTALRKEIEAKQNRELETERRKNELKSKINTLEQEKLQIEKDQQECAAMEKR